MKISIAIGADHRGFALKQELIQIEFFGKVEVAWRDVGTDSLERTDYPIYTKAVVYALRAHKAHYGVMICGSGIGATIAANRYQGIYAGLVWNADVARTAKEHDNCNLIVLPADYMCKEGAQEALIAWLHASFLEGRYAERLVMLEDDLTTHAQEKK